MQPLVVITRSNYIESIHYGDLCVSDPNKKTILSIGDGNTKVYIRSAAKPFQALPIVLSGALEKYKITSEELAVICGSHSGQAYHRTAVSSILNKIELSEDHLSCGIANPYNKDMQNELIKNGESPTKLYNTCSGSHAGTLILCKYYGYPVEYYYKPDHPVQILILNILAELLDCNKSDITIGLDGCGVPTYMITIKQAAFLYSLLAQGSYGSSKYKDDLEVIQKAMLANPYMISGDNEFCSDLIYFSNGKVIGKIGAEGIYCIAVPEKQLGICIKISDGRERSVHPSAIHVLKQLGVLDENTIEKLKNWAYPPLKNHKGELTGCTIPVFDINNIESTRNYTIGMRFQ